MWRKVATGATLLAFAWLGSCAPTGWNLAAGLYRSQHGAYSVMLPDSLMVLNGNDTMYISRYGPLMEGVTISRRLLNDGFPNTRLTLRKDMLPHQTANVVLSNFNLAPEVGNPKIQKLSPVTIGGIPGFEALILYQSPDGIAMKTLIDGLVVDQWYYEIRLIAISEFYFDKALPYFEKIIAGFKIAASVKEK